MEKISYISWMFSLLVLCGFEVQAQSSDQVYFNRNDIKFSEVTENQTVYLINENELPEVVTSEDGTVDIDFGGGRIASIGVYTRINNQVRTTGRITEITCLNSTANSNCDISMGSIFRTHRLYWRRHPNPNKMGKQVKLKEYNSTVDNDPGSVPVQTFLFGSYEKNFHRVGSNFLLSQEELQQLNPVKFVCDNESWMTEINQYLGITSNEFVVNEWVTEAMEENRETGVNENRTDMGVFGVVFDILEDGGIQLKEFKYPFTQRENNMGALIAGDIVGMNLSADGKTCDVSMNINVEGLANQIFLDGEDDQL
ncbi:MAG: hypothetical protein HRT44_12985, partial [Bdellovibrionales bacterium]|nr:hypothetical protein [Bdellovibrionales bacterium]NQZ20152.1 hypothetical protein [Bdellovibrionales bacterium]